MIYAISCGDLREDKPMIVNPWHTFTQRSSANNDNQVLANYLRYDTLASMESSQYLMPHMPTCMGWFCAYDFVFPSRQNLTNHLKYLSKLWSRVQHNNIPHVVLYLKLILDKFHSSIAHKKSASAMINAMKIDTYIWSTCCINVDNILVVKFGSCIGVCWYEFYIMFPMTTHWDYLTQHAKEDVLGEQELE